MTLFFRQNVQERKTEIKKKGAKLTCNWRYSGKVCCWDWVLGQDSIIVQIKPAKAWILECLSIVSWRDKALDKAPENKSNKNTSKYWDYKWKVFKFCINGLKKSNQFGVEFVLKKKELKFLSIILIKPKLNLFSKYYIIDNRISWYILNK